MRKRMIAFLLSIGIVLSMAGCRDANISYEPDTQQLVEEEIQTLEKYSYTDFALRLFQAAVSQTTGEENVLISPLSIYLALGMLENGAKNETLAQIEEVVGLESEEMNLLVQTYMKYFTDKVKTANSIWVAEKEGFTVEENFLAVNQTYYDAELISLPFNEKAVEEMNHWIEKNTNGMLKEVIEKIPPEAVMYLVNALTFESEWQENYKEHQIRTGSFRCSNGKLQDVAMMYSDESYYLEDENATGFLKYYDGGEYAFVALLPNEGVLLSDYIYSVYGEKWTKMLENPMEVHVSAGIPQFQTEYRMEGKEVLAALGILDIFDAEKSDLSGIGSSVVGNLFVSQLLHKTCIEVTPMGTKAGASTVVEVVNESALEIGESKEVILNRPFLYMIVECESNQPIFMGTVHEVEKILAKN